MTRKHRDLIGSTGKLRGRLEKRNGLARRYGDHHRIKSVVAGPGFRLETPGADTLIRRPKRSDSFADRHFEITRQLSRNARHARCTDVAPGPALASRQFSGAQKVHRGEPLSRNASVAPVLHLFHKFRGTTRKILGTVVKSVRLVAPCRHAPPRTARFLKNADRVSRLMKFSGTHKPRHAGTHNSDTAQAGRPSANPRPLLAQAVPGIETFTTTSYRLRKRNGVRLGASRQTFPAAASGPRCYEGSQRLLDEYSSRRTTTRLVPRRSSDRVQPTLRAGGGAASQPQPASEFS